MKWLLLLLTAFAPALPAASWDGTHGDLTVMTMMPPPSLPGLPGIVVNRVTQIFVRSTDEAVVAYRVAIQVTGKPAMTYIAEKLPRGYMSVALFFNVDISEIKSVSITKLHDGETTTLN